MTMEQINARNLLCPMPVIRLQNAMKHKKNGEHVQIFCTDPGVKFDIPAWCQVHGHEIISMITSEDCIIIEVAFRAT